MSKLILKSEIEDMIPLCNNKDFVESFNNRMSYRLLNVVKLKHGHTEYGKLNYHRIVPHIHRQDRKNSMPVTKRYIGILYFQALSKMKELIHEKK